jgi:hypothetical protein
MSLPAGGPAEGREVVTIGVLLMRPTPHRIVVAWTLMIPGDY